MNEEKNNSFEDEKEEKTPDEKINEQSSPEEEKPSIDEVADSLDLEDDSLPPPPSADFSPGGKEVPEDKEISDEDFEGGPLPEDDKETQDKPSIDEVADTFEISDLDSGEETKKPEEEKSPDIEQENITDMEEISSGGSPADTPKEEDPVLPKDSDLNLEGIEPLNSVENEKEEALPDDEVMDDGIENVDLNLDEFDDSDDSGAQERPPEGIENEIKNIETEVGLDAGPTEPEEKKEEILPEEEPASLEPPESEEEMSETSESETLAQEEPSEEDEKPAKAKKSKTGLILVAVLLLAIGGAAYYYMDTIISLIIGAPSEVRVVVPPEPAAPPTPPVPEYDSPFIYTEASNVSKDVSDGIVTFSWQTPDGIEKVRGFYKSRLEVMDYIIEKDEFDSAAGLAHMVFKRDDVGRLAVVLRRSEDLVSAHVSHVR